MLAVVVARKAACVFWLLFCSSLFVVSANPTGILTGTTYYDPVKAYNGFVLYPSQDGKTYLIDMNGHEVKVWPYASFPPYPLTVNQAHGRKGSVLLRLAPTKQLLPHANPGNGLTNAAIAEISWNNQIDWQYGSQQQPVGQHHDISREPNGNTLVLTASLRSFPGFNQPIIDNSVQQISFSGDVIWSWSMVEHLADFGYTSQQLQRLKQSRDPDIFHLNTAKQLGENHWYDEGDRRFAPDNILINSRNANIAAIIDHQTGKIVWRLGPYLPTTQLTGNVPRPVDQTIGSHDVHLIAKGLPGAGHILIFDNQGDAGYPSPERGMFMASRVIEIDPVSREIVWQYTAEDSGQAVWTFFSAFISNAQRLPNGNTLITEGQSGRIFQVTPKGKIVWEYVTPHYGRSMAQDHYQTNYIYRAVMVSYDWAPEGTAHQEKAVQLAIDTPERKAV